VDEQHDQSCNVKVKWLGVDTSVAVKDTPSKVKDSTLKAKVKDLTFKVKTEAHVGEQRDQSCNVKVKWLGVDSRYQCWSQGHTAQGQGQ